MPAGPAESANQPLAAMHALPDTAPCPCGRCEPAAKRQPRPVAFGNCCAPLLRGQQAAADAQALMRSRYSAYVLGDLAYLRSSWHPSTCPPDLSLDDDVQWLGLKIERYHPTSATEAEVVPLTGQPDRVPDRIGAAAETPPPREAVAGTAPEPVDLHQPKA